MSENIPSTETSEPPSTLGRRKSTSSPPSGENRRKAPKASRACDTCKLKKARCSGTIPCTRCSRRHLNCVYNAEYHRGHWRRGLTPGAPSQPQTTGANEQELDAEEIEGQYIEPTSGFTFLHRAHKRLSMQQRNTDSHVPSTSDRLMPLRMAGDKPLQLAELPGWTDIPANAQDILVCYFEDSVVTYRMFHRQRVMMWLNTIQQDRQQGLQPTHHAGNARAAVIFAIMAIVMLRSARRDSQSDPSWSEEKTLAVTDQYISVASSLTDSEAGLPRLESAQARLTLVLYFLQTGRMNSAWYLLGDAYQIVVALGLHRRPSQKHGQSARSQDDYIDLQCQRRTFWVAYTIDAYLSVVLGRPRYLHDQDINQEFPASINDEEMTPQGPRVSDADTGLGTDSGMDAVIAHAKLARILGCISRDVYSIAGASTGERHVAARRLGQRLTAWWEGLPPHLSTVHPSSLIPTLRRQAVALKLAYCHAMIHAKRPFLLLDPGGGTGGGTGGGGAGPSREEDEDDEDDDDVRETAADCIRWATLALQTVVAARRDPTLAHAFWWAPYVTFCALAVVYVWDITHASPARGGGGGGGGRLLSDAKLAALTERCHEFLARSPSSSDSPSRRYTVILEELSQEAKAHRSSGGGGGGGGGVGQLAEIDATAAMPDQGIGSEPAAAQLPLEYPAALGASEMVSAADDLYPFRDWQTTDWLDLDASVSPLTTTGWYR
ncbi:fungal-specific transcription factor domain-containing protein [Xylariaceae sp. FL0804]|nr:fungal-specific transcription factor domain-containing protein [Xylariaceae sp. FL0804]